MASLFKTPLPRRFEYRPQFYSPPKDDENEEGHRIRFRRLNKHYHPQKKSVFVYILMLLVLLFVLRYLTKLERSGRTLEMQEIRIEDVEGIIP